MDPIKRFFKLIGIETKSNADQMDAIRYAYPRTSKETLETIQKFKDCGVDVKFTEEPITAYGLDAKAEDQQSALKAQEEEEKMSKERVTLFESPIYSEEHLQTVRDSLDIMGLHYEIKTEKAEAYKPHVFVPDPFGVHPMYTIKVQTEKEKVKKEIEIDGGRTYEVEAAEDSEYKPVPAAGYEMKDGKLHEVYLNAPASDGAPVEGVATYKNTNCAICSAPPNLERLEPNYYSERGAAWFCEPHYIEVREGAPAEDKPLPEIETLKAEINTIRADLDRMNEKGISPTEEEKSRLHHKLSKLKRLNAEKIEQ